MSGSGKSWLSARLADRLPAIRIRSDSERKRILTLPAGSTTTGIGEGLYTAEATDRTYARLLELALGIVEAGWSVIVDASFLDTGRRRDFVALAERQQLPYVLLCCEAEPGCLRERIVARSEEGRDPSDAGLEVLDAQLRGLQPIGTDEAAHRLTVHTDRDVDLAELISRLDELTGT